MYLDMYFVLIAIVMYLAIIASYIAIASYSLNIAMHDHVQLA